MIGSVPNALVTRTTPSARVQRRRVDTGELGEETAAVETSGLAPRVQVGTVAPGFEQDVVSTPRPAMRNVAAAALAAILKLPRGG